MKLSHVLKCSVLGGVLLCSLGSGWALTLGRAQGAVLLGQPLDLSITVQVAADEDISQLCFQADVVYGDNRQDPGRISVSTEGLRSGTPGKIRVLVSARINEPVVTLDLRSTCAYKTTRQYVLLADLASEVTAPAPTRSAANTDALALAPAPAKQATVAPSPAPVVRSARPAPAPAAVRPPTPPKTQAPRLKLALLNPAPASESELKMSPELPLVSDDDAKKREASAALWRALNLTPEDALNDSTRAAAVDKQIQLLQSQTATNQQLLAEMSTRLEKSRAQRYANPLIYGLLILLAVCGGVLAYGWRQWRLDHTGIAPWWRGHAAQDDADVSQFERRAQERVATPAPLVSPAAAEVDIDLQLADSAFSDLGKPVPQMATAPAPTAPTPGARTNRDFAHSTRGSLREINSQEILDARQQAEFFMTLGQYPQAIAVLERCIQDNAQATPWVYLDLLGVLHTLGRKADYDTCRAQFNRVFSGVVPEFSDFSQGGRGLEDYAEVCARIVALWPGAEALDYIEKALVRSGPADASEGLDLNAYQDLLMLHSVVQQIAPKTEVIDFDLT